MTDNNPLQMLHTNNQGNELPKNQSNVMRLGKYGSVHPVVYMVA